MKLLICNCGSSSIKFALFDTDPNFEKKYSGSIIGIGISGSFFIVKDHTTNEQSKTKISINRFEDAVEILLQYISETTGFGDINVVGHRIVHGMKHVEPALINNNLIKELKSISNLDPDHLPAEILLIEKIKQQRPELMQVACFDTSFHSTMPVVAKMFALPRSFYDEGMMRYGFHGLSYNYLLEGLKNKIGDEANGKIIMAHLGNGASLAAIKDGKSIDTSMGFTPTGGTVMGTRSGDFDPGIAWHLMKNKKINADEFSDIINHKSGLLGISGISADMQQLLQIENENKNAKEAIELFCYNIKKWIGAFAAVLNGVEVLVFSGGIGENSPVIRSRICDGLSFLGVEINAGENEKNSFQISSQKSNMKVFVIPTDEELIIAKNSVKLYEESKM